MVPAFDIIYLSLSEISCCLDPEIQFMNFVDQKLKTSKTTNEKHITIHKTK